MEFEDRVRQPRVVFSPVRTRSVPVQTRLLDPFEPGWKGRSFPSEGAVRSSDLSVRFEPTHVDASTHDGDACGADGAHCIHLDRRRERRERGTFLCDVRQRTAAGPASVQSILFPFGLVQVASGSPLEQRGTPARNEHGALGVQRQHLQAHRSARSFRCIQGREESGPKRRLRSLR